MNQYIADDENLDSGCRTFEPIHMKRSLIKMYGEKILITEINGKPNMVTFKNSVSNILLGYKTESMNECFNLNGERQRLVRYAAKMIKSQRALQWKRHKFKISCNRPGHNSSGQA